MPRRLGRLLIAGLASALLAQTAHATPPPALDAIAAARSLTTDRAVVALVERAKHAVEAELRAKTFSSTTPFVMPSSQQLLTGLADAATPITALDPADAAVVARINALVAMPAYQAALRALANAAPQRLPDATTPALRQTAYLLHLLGEESPGFSFKTLAKIVTVVAGAVAVVAAGVACATPPVTVVCIVGAVAGGVVFASGTYLLLADDATHSINIRDVTCAPAYYCVATSAASSTATLSGTRIIGGAAWSFQNLPANPTACYCGGGSSWSFTPTASQSGLHTYTVYNVFDGNEQYDQSRCYMWVDVTVDVVWSDHSYSEDETVKNKPTEASQYC